MAANLVPPRAAPRPPWIVWLGLGIVLAAAAVLSFDALRGLGVAVGIPRQIAWLLPLAVDAGAAVSCAVWLGRRATPDAARYAGRMTWSLLAVTVLGNAIQLGIHADGVSPWRVALAVAVGAIPPAVVGSTVHLVVLLVRPAQTGPVRPGPAEATGPDRAEDEDDPGEWSDPWEKWGVPTETTPVPLRTASRDRDPLHDEVVRWAATLPDRPSQRAVRERFSVGATRARRLHEALEGA